jgi:DHA3 family macrolide efflux protein-like MFS transporter
MTSMAQLFRNRVIQAILFSALFLQIGVWVRNFAVLLFVVDQTKGDPLAISMISIAEFLPIFLFSFIGGTFADRWRPKRTMIWCDLLSAASSFLVLVTILFFTWKAVFFATLISAILSQFSQPSGMKLFKMHVPAEQIQLGMSLYQTIFAVFMILGPILGTYVYENFGIGLAIAIMGISFVLSAVVLFFLPEDRRMEEKDEKSILQDMTAGIRYVLSKKTLTLLSGCFVTAGLALGMIQPLAVFLVTERLELEKDALQWLFMAHGIGMILGGGVAMGLAKSLSPQKLLIFSMTISAAGIAGAGLSTILWLTLLFEVIIGIVMPAIHISINTMILQHTEEAFVGRVNGILSPLFMGGMVLTMSIAGILKGWFPIEAIYVASGLLFFIGSLFVVPMMRLQMESTQTEESR